MKKHVTQYIIKYNLVALLEQLSKGYSTHIKNHMESTGFTADEAATAIAVLEAVNCSNTERTYSDIKQALEASLDALRE